MIWQQEHSKSRNHTTNQHSIENFCEQCLSIMMQAIQVHLQVGVLQISPLSLLRHCNCAHCAVTDDAQACSKCELYWETLNLPRSVHVSDDFLISFKSSFLFTAYKLFYGIIWNLGTHDFRYNFTILFIYMNSYVNS